MANNHGGARPGAGRKPLREKYGAKVAATEDIVADALEQAARNLVALANGGLTRTEEKSIPANQVMTKVLVRDKDGNPVLNKAGFPLIAELPVNPKADPSQMTVVERRVTTLLPDLGANQYLIDRIVGRPVQAQEGSLDLNIGDGGIAARLAEICDSLRARRDSQTDN